MKRAQGKRTTADTILDALADAVLVYDAEARVVGANPAATALFGFAPIGLREEELLRHVSITAPDGRPAAPSVLPAGRVLRGQGRVHERYHLVNRQGQRFALEALATPLCRQSRLIGAVVVWHDISEHEQIQETAQASEHRYRSLFDQMSEGFALHELVYDAAGEPCDYRFLEVNPAFGEC